MTIITVWERKKEKKKVEKEKKKKASTSLSLAFVLMDDSTFMVERLALAGEWDSLQNVVSMVHDNVFLLIALPHCLLATFPHSGHNIDKHS